MTTTKRREIQLDAGLDNRVQFVADQAGVTFSDVARRALTQVAAEPGPYRFDGTGPSLVRDIWANANSGDSEARWRLDAFRKWNTDMEKFATANTTNSAAVIPPGYQSSPFAGLLIAADRPFAAAATAVPLPNPTPFTLPGIVSAAGATTQHTEGVNPSEGTLTFAGPQTVTPKGYSGEFRVTRELIDSSNPAVDAIALSALRESFAEQTEAVVYAELNGASGQGGTITSGFVPSGAQVSTATGTAALTTELKKALAHYPFRRRRKARTVITSEEATDALSGVLDERTGDAEAMWRLQGAAVNPGPVITGNTAGDADVFILGADDLLAWEAPVLTWTWSERAGPAYIDLALFGYFATRLLRPVGLAAIRYTAGA